MPASERGVRTMRIGNRHKGARRARITALVLAALLVFTMVPVSAADAPSSWAAQELEQARAKGLVIPEADSNFQGSIDRALFCKLVVNLVETVNGYDVQLDGRDPFEDTDDPAILKAYQLGVVAGKTSTVFAPADPITREQIAAMMMRAARALDVFHSTTFAVIPADQLALLSFADQGSIAAYALSDVRLANYLGIMLGVGGNRINPKGNTTVEQGILLVNRLFDGFTTFRDADNRPPVALGDPVVFTVREGETLTIAADQLAVDPDGDALTINAADHNTSIGRVNVQDDGTATYVSNDITADATYNFALQVYDGKASKRVNVQVRVTALTLILDLRPSLASVTIEGDMGVGAALRVSEILYLGGKPVPVPSMHYTWMRAPSADGPYTTVFAGTTASAYIIGDDDVGYYFCLVLTVGGTATGSKQSNVLGPVENRLWQPDWSF